MSAVPGNPWWSFSTAGRIVYGSDSRRFLPDAVASLGNRVLLCTDANLSSVGAVEPLVAALRAKSGLDVLVYDEGEAEIGFAGVERCVAAVRAFSPEVVVGLGGGSNLDLAKVVAARLTTDHRVASWMSEGGSPSSSLPIIAMPTTAGTGSEVTSIAVLTDEDNDLKVGLVNRSFLPRVSIVDPVLTISCPARVTAHSGFDALTHALEAYTAIDFTRRAPPAFSDQGYVGKNPLSDAIALQAIELIGANLENAVSHGDDLVARENMALGSMLAGMAFATAGTAIVHALQYPIGTRTKTPHGLGNAVLLPAALRCNLEVRTREAAVVSRLLGSKRKDESEAAGALPDLVGRLAMAVGITPNLASLGVRESELEQIAGAAAKITRLTENNPRPVDEKFLLEVLRQAFDYLPAKDSAA